jgi:hypothetical protein
LSIREFPRQLLERAQIDKRKKGKGGDVHDIMSCLGSESAEIAVRTGLPKLALSILVNDKKNSQRKESVTGRSRIYKFMDVPYASNLIYLGVRDEIIHSPMRDARANDATRLIQNSSPLLPD